MTSRRWFWALLLVAEVLFAVQGVHLARLMLTWPDESSYLHIGYLTVTGQARPFQDDFLGSRVPLPFYVLGLSQVIWGRDLLAARLMSLALALAAVALAALVARRLAGDLAGGLAALFFASQGVIVGYFSTATYHALGGALLLGGLALILGPAPVAGPVAGMAVISLLFLTRGNLWPALPAVLAVLLWRARDRRERLLLVAAAVAVPLAFLLWSPEHVKVLAYVPVVRRWLVPDEYASTLALTDVPARSIGDRVWAVLRVGRMYEYWWLAALLLAAVAGLSSVTGRRIRALAGDRRAQLIAALLAYMFVWQIVLFWQFPKTLAAYFPTFGPLVAILLGVGYARTLTGLGDRPPLRAVVIAGLVALLVLPAVIVRHPLLPLASDVDPNPPRELAAAGRHLARLIPPGSRVFLWGDSLPLYLAGRTPYLRQIHSAQTLAQVQDREAIRHNGLWGVEEMEAWLGRDADYAVIQESLLNHYRGDPRMPVRLMEDLLARHFERIDRVADYRWFPQDVYRRRSRAEGPPPVAPLAPGPASR